MIDVDRLADALTALHLGRDGFCGESHRGEATTIAEAYARAGRLPSETWVEVVLDGQIVSSWVICGAAEPGPFTVGEAHTCTLPPRHDGEHDW